jgi:hypothetical protein
VLRISTAPQSRHTTSWFSSMSPKLRTRLRRCSHALGRSSECGVGCLHRSRSSPPLPSRRSPRVGSAIARTMY